MLSNGHCPYTAHWIKGCPLDNPLSPNYCAKCLGTFFFIKSFANTDTIDMTSTIIFIGPVENMLES